MLNKYSIGFACVAAVVVAGVDYFDQSNKAGMALGEMSAGVYFQTIPARFSDAKEEKLAEASERERKSQWRKGGLPHLPEAPEGWSRRALLEGDDSAIMPADKLGDHDGAGGSFLEQMEARDEVKRHKERAKRSWIYQRGTETVFVEVETYERPSSNSMIGLVESTLNAAAFGGFDKTFGYDVVGGVGFTEKMNSDGKREYHFRQLEGIIGFGHEVHLTVHANASRESTFEILNAIDFDGLNALLPLPVATVGNDVTVPQGMDVKALAKDMYDLRQEFLNLRATEAQFRIANLDASALLVNTYSQAYGGEDGVMDITGGKSVDLSTLIDLGFHTALASLMEGKTTEEITAEVDKMVKQVMWVADAETAAAAARAENAPAPEMSPELRAELSASLEAGNSQSGTAAELDRSYQEAELSVVALQSAPLADVDHGAATVEDGAPEMIVSKRLPEDKVRKIQEDPDNIAMRVGLAAAVKRFEGKLGLPTGSCEFSMTEYRVECEKAKPAAERGILGFINKATDGGLTQQQSTPTGLQSGEKPKRLELSGGQQRSGSRCVGSFCD